MRKILSEKNVAAILFVLVILAFSFAHEDSKKRSLHYNASVNRLSSDKRTPVLSEKFASPSVVEKELTPEN